MVMYNVYKHKTPNNKIYIGITSMKPEQRWANGEGYKQQLLFYRAIKKYGWENIAHEVLFSDLTQEEAEQKEIILISDYQCNNPAFGYNIQNGGSLAGKHSIATKNKLSKLKKGVKFSDNHKLKLSKARTGKPSPKGMLGKSMSEEAKQKMSIAHKGKEQSLEHRKNAAEAHKGYKHSAEIKSKISNTKKGTTFSIEHKQKISESIRLNWERRKADGHATNHK